MRFWLGGYTADMGGPARGIGSLLAGGADDASAGGGLTFEGDAAAAPSPSWVVRHPSLDVVYAALEGIGKVAAFAQTGEATLARLGPAVEAGEAVCHLAVAPDGSALIASCYGDGRVVRIALDAEGAPSSPLIAAAATDPYAGPEGAAPAAFVLPAAPAAESDGAVLLLEFRAALAAAEAGRTRDDVSAGEAPDQDSVSTRPSRAHSAVFLPDGRIATADLGFDIVRIWRVGSAGLVADHDVVLPHGCGPRHMTVHPSGHVHVMTEYSCEVFTLGPTREGRWALVGGTPASPQGLPSFDFGAEITRSRDGGFLYAGLRGSNTIATLRVRGAGESVEPVALVDAGVDWPRHHIVERDILVVAGQRSNEVASLTLDERTGVPGRVRHRAEAPAPTCITPIR